MSFVGSVNVQPLITPPTSGWSWYNQSSSVATQVGNAIQLWHPRSGNADNMVMYYQTPPSTPYTAIARFRVNAGSGVINNRGNTLKLYGLSFTDGTATVALNVRFSSTQSAAWSVLYCSGSTTASANLGNNFQSASGFPWANIGWAMLRNDGTNIEFYVGDETGKNFELVYSEAKGSHLGTITGIGPWVDCGNNAAEVNWTLDSWQVLGV